MTIGQIQMDGARASLAGFAIQIHNGQHTSIRTARKCVENVKFDKAALNTGMMSHLLIRGRPNKCDNIKSNKMKRKIIKVQNPSYDLAKKPQKNSKHCALAFEGQLEIK